MAIIQKRADELKPGDIIVISSVNVEPHVSERRVIVTVERQHGGAADTLMLLYALAGARMQQRTVSMFCELHAAANVEVADPLVAADDLDALLDAACALLNPHDRKAFDETRGRALELAELVDRLRPPAPPTLTEALVALLDVSEIKKAPPALNERQARRLRAALDVIERARRAGLLLKGDT